MKKTFAVVTLVLGVIANRAAEMPGTNALAITPALIRALYNELRTNHPAIGAAAGRARAAGLGTNAVRIWDDPVFRFGGVTASPRGPQLNEEGDLIYGLEQKLPLFGKPQAARRVAAAGSDSEAARLDYQFQILRRDLVKALFRVAFTERAIQIAAQDVAWLDTMAVTTEEHYRAGTSTQVELLRVQNERSKRTEQLRTETNRRDHERLALNRLLNRKLHAPLPGLDLPSLADAVPYHPGLADHAAASEPKLRVLRMEIRQAEALVAASRKARLPDVSAGIEGRQYSGDGGFREGMFTVSLSLPWLNHDKYRSDVAREEARLQAAELDAADYQLSLREGVHNLTLNIDAARREALLYQNEILPRSRQALESAHAQWTANRGMFNDVMDSRRMLLEAQLALARAVSEQHQLLADLALLCGVEDLAELRFMVGQGAPAATTTPRP